ncbi:MAG: anion transporter [Elusimicrobiales bacterium]|jgi:Na+/H+ antiporter NhaD/arsenite permease-like protein
MFPIIVLILIFLLIAVRQVGNFRLQIWQIMTAGASAVVLSGDLSPAEALRAVDPDVMLFLFGMFVTGAALELSGYLAHLEYSFFKRAGSLDQLVFFVLFGSAFASAALMNDTLAIIGTPVVLLLAKKHGMSPKLLLLALAFGVTIGSVMSPIGNPQNLLVAVKGGVAAPFLTFLKYLFLPTLLNLFAAFFLLKVMYRPHFSAGRLAHSQEPIKDRRLGLLSRASLAVLGVMITVKVLAVYLSPAADFKLTYIALAAMLPPLLFSSRRLELLKKTDWSTLVFFAAMFILMKSVWNTGFFQRGMARTGFGLASTPMILAVSVIVSQLISNVPLVALYLPALLRAGAGVPGLMALAAGSTIAGNLFILGAASNVIIIQAAEKKTGATLTFFEFARVGVPLTIINAAVYWLFL